ncbi:hypothetical protein D3C79_951730 [compost metagenome]
MHGNAGFLRGDHHVGQVDTTLADLESIGELGRRLLGLVHFADGLAEHVSEAALAFCQFGGGSGFWQRHGIGLHGTHVQHQTIEFNTLAHELLSPAAAFF